MRATLLPDNTPLSLLPKSNVCFEAQSSRTDTEFPNTAPFESASYLVSEPSLLAPLGF